MKPVRTAAARVGRSLSRLLGGGAVAASLAIHGAGAALALLVGPVLARHVGTGAAESKAPPPLVLDLEITEGIPTGDGVGPGRAPPAAARPATPRPPHLTPSAPPRTPHPATAATPQAAPERVRSQALAFARAPSPLAPRPADPNSPSSAISGERAAPVRRFAMSGGSIAGRTAPAGDAALMQAPFSPRAGEGTDAVTEESVDVPATVVQRAPALYPEAARRAEIEADVPLLLTLSAAGAVTEATALSHPGYGLEEAALRAARGYLFRPALRAGRPVPVRMRWVIQFRLR